MSTQGQQIRQRRKQLGLTQQDLAEAVGSHVQTIDKIERDLIKFSRYLFPISTRLGIVISSSHSGHAGNTPTPTVPPPAPGFISPQRDLPVYGSSPKGTQMLMSKEPIGYTLRPEPLDSIREAYSVLVSTEAMEPAYEPGDIISLNPHKPLEVGKDVLLRTDDADTALCILCRLLSISNDRWRVCQWAYNRQRAFDVSRAEFPACHRVVATYHR